MFDESLVDEHIKNDRLREQRAYRNWRILRIRLRFVCKHIHMMKHIDYEDEEPGIMWWFETGNFCLLPQTNHFQIWMLMKSFLYIIDMYYLVFEMAFQAHELEEHDHLEQHKPFSELVNVVQIIDMILHCFTAIKQTEVTDWTR